ncbi:MAG: polysaccharide deacetylase family protein [Magnetococcales bacterium]|nr:polysaccharide deacetylase family protein [Magnetococcales bacterium]
MSPYAIMFHHFHNQQHPRGQGAISGGEFRELLEHVGMDRLLPAHEWLDRVQAGTLGENDLCLSFDDGLRCQYDIAVPVMRELGLTAFWFAYTGPMSGEKDTLEIYRYFRTVQFDHVDAFYGAFYQTCRKLDLWDQITQGLEGFDPAGYLAPHRFYSNNDRTFRYVRNTILGAERYETVMDTMISGNGFDADKISDQLWMKPEQLKELHDAGFVIGLHSHSHHNRIIDLPQARQEAEYTTNARHLKAITGEDPITVSYPCNAYDAETLRFLSSIGVRVGFRTDLFDTPKSLLELPRMDHIEVIRQMKKPKSRPNDQNKSNTRSGS